MKQPRKASRLFKKNDELMLQQSDVVLDSFLANKSLFAERFFDLADPFADQWAAASAIARAARPDFELVAEQSLESARLETLMKQGRNLFQTVMLYTQLAFPDNAAVLHLFGRPQYHSIRSSHLKLSVLLISTFTDASKPEYKPALIATGLKEQEIAQLDILAEKITLQNAALQNAKKNRMVATIERIAKMNTVWKKMALVCKCAKLVFQNDAAEYNLFLLADGQTRMAP
ncbi:MAG: hypothetical protein K0M40_19515 [Prolixibacteraceae bacterium]|nr:hypothetical protein [Prolixibacteraceae bacterium]